MNYIILHSLLFITIFFSKYFTKEFNFIILISFGYFLALYPGLRYVTGADYFNYLDIFNSVKPLFEYSGFQEISDDYTLIHGEFGFLLINSIFKQLGLSFEVLLLFLAFLNITILIIAINRNSVNFLMSLFIYISIFYAATQFSQIRLGMVMSIFLLSISYIDKSKIFFSFLLIAGAFFFHKILLLGFLIYFVKKIHFTYLKGIVFLVLAIVFNEFNFLNLIVSILSGINIEAIVQLNHYKADKNYIDNKPPYLMLFFMFAIYLYSLYIIKLNNIFDKYINMLLGIFLFSLVFNILFYNIQIVGGRFSSLYMIVFIFIVPYVFYNNSFKVHSCIYFLLIFIYSFYRYYKLIFLENNNLYPYTSILNQGY